MESTFQCYQHILYTLSLKILFILDERLHHIEQTYLPD